jgi:hypothetical protein
MIREYFISFPCSSFSFSQDCDKRAGEEAGVVTVRCDGIVLDGNGAIVSQHRYIANFSL